MPVGTSDGEYYEDEFDHAVQTSFKGAVDSPIPSIDAFQKNNAPAASTRSPRGNLGDILSMDVHDIPEGVSARDYFKQLQSQDDQSYKKVSQNPVTGPAQGQAQSTESTEKYPLFVVRHGCTDLNAEGGTSTDKIRGWSNVPLNDVGRQDAKDAAKSLEGKGITKIVASDLDRAKETADIIGKHLGVTPDYTMKLRPWDLGKFTGEPAKESREDLKDYSSKTPDKVVPEGESFNSFRFRALQGVSEAIKNNPGEKVAIVTHHRVERLLNAWDKQGQPTDGSLHEPTFLQKGEPPGGHQIIDISPNVHNVMYQQHPKVLGKKAEQVPSYSYTPGRGGLIDRLDPRFQAEVDDRRDEPFDWIEGLTGLTLEEHKKAISHPITPWRELFPEKFGRTSPKEKDSELGQEAGSGDIIPEKKLPKPPASWRDLLP